MQARYYDPVIGRFYSNDPVGFTGEIDTFNRYSYVANNPYKYTDPTGEEKYSIGVTAEAMLIAGVRISLSASIDTDNLEIGAAVSAGPRLGLGVGIGGAYDVTQSETGAAKTETKDGGVSVTADGQIGPLSLGGEIMSDATLSGQNSTTAGTSDGNDKTSNLKGKLGIAGSIGVEFKGEATSSALADTVAEVKSWF
jgi:uncharacterized protein RhaS with RHS repeats